MKKLILYAITPLLVLGLVTCALPPEEPAEPAMPVQPAEPDEPAEPTSFAEQLPQQNLDFDGVLAQLNQVMEDSGKPGRFGNYANKLGIVDLPAATVYYDLSPTYTEAIVYFDKDNQSWHYLDLRPVSCYWVQDFYQLPESPEQIQISCKSICHGGDSMYTNYGSIVSYSLSERAVVDVLYRPDSGVYGMVYSLDHQRFTDCEITDGQALLRFELIPGFGNGYAGPEILVRLDMDYDNDIYSWLFAFRNTEMNLSGSFVQSLRELEGIDSLSMKYVETSTFTGTELYITCKPGYTVESAFNQSGGIHMLEDFSFRCMEGYGLSATTHYPGFE